MTHLDLFALIVEDYDPAIDFFVRVLRFELIEDVPSTTNDGRPKRWVVVRPGGGTTGILLARADGEHQESAVGHQFAGRVGLFLRVDDFDAAYARMIDAASRSSRRRARSPSAKSLSSSTSRAIAGISWGRASTGDKVPKWSLSGTCSPRGPTRLAADAHAESP